MPQKKEDIFNVLLDSMSEGVIVVNEQQIIVEANSAVKKMFGYEKDELVNEPLKKLIPPNFHGKHDGHFQGFMKEKKYRQMGHGRDIIGLRKDGSVFPLEAGLNPFTIYGKNYVMSIIIDITARKKQEEELNELNNSLEQKVEIRTKELEEVVSELKHLNEELDAENKLRLKAEEEAKEALKKEQELNELKTRFLSLVSHEFKTPLSGILTSTILLSKYNLTNQQEKREKHLKTITDKVHYLNNILQDFLSIEKIETGKIVYKPTTFTLSKVLNEVVYNANMLLKDGQNINYPEEIDDFYLHHDEKIIELILSNLVHNAIKYSSENSVIDVKISQNESETTFKIVDNGIGIPKKDQKNIFNRYFRAENALLTQGTGIGLNIVKSHIENLNGSISFTSKENVGTTFTINLPNKATS